MPKTKVIKKTAVVAKKAVAKPVKKVTRAATTAKTTTKRVRPEIPTWVAPADFKPFFLEVVVKTDKDGLLGTGIRATRFQGRYDPNADPRKKFDMSTYDQPTVQGILARLAMTTYVTNQTKRLPANTTFRIVIRVANRRTKGNILACTFKSIEQVHKLKTGKAKPVMLDKKDPMYRKFRKSSRILPGAFKAVLMPPKRTRGKKQTEE